MIHTTYCSSPFGSFEITGSYLGIQSVKLVDEIREQQKDPPELLTECARQLQAYFRRERKSFDVLLDWADKPKFNQSVWKELLNIPYGRTTSYSAIAEKIGQPNAVRAVGLANRNNPIAIIVPCHRVLAKNGNLQGYFYGLDMKRQLLELENPAGFARQGSLF